MNGAKEGAQLTADNEKAWKGIPGTYDINIHHNNYFFNCTNSNNVIYKGAKPELEQFGPYIYREWNTFDDV